MQTRKLFFSSLAALAVVAVLHNLAEMYNLYERFHIPVIQTGWFDLFPHFIGGMSISFGILWLAVRVGLWLKQKGLEKNIGGVSLTFNNGIPAWTTLLLVLITTLLIGLAWELFEVSLWTVIHPQIPDGWLLDTLKDLTMDVLGAITAWAIVHRVQWIV